MQRFNAMFVSNGEKVTITVSKSKSQKSTFWFRPNFLTEIQKSEIQSHDILADCNLDFQKFISI